MNRNSRSLAQSVRRPRMKNKALPALSTLSMVIGSLASSGAHANPTGGNVVGAALSGWFGWLYGFTAVFWLAAAFGALSIVSVLMIPSDSIDDDDARGLEHEGGDEGRARGFRVLVETNPATVA